MQFTSKQVITVESVAVDIEKVVVNRISFTFTNMADKYNIYIHSRLEFILLSTSIPKT